MILSHAQWPLGTPLPKPGYATLPTGRLVYWTGRVAIGLRHPSPPSPPRTPVPHSQLWVQELVLDNRLRPAL